MKVQGIFFWKVLGAVRSQKPRFTQFCGEPASSQLNVTPTCLVMEFWWGNSITFKEPT
jgi:hypothetical protein